MLAIILSTLFIGAAIAVVYLYRKANWNATIRRARETVEEMAAAGRGHYEYNGPFEAGDLVCNGHFPKDSAEIVCFTEEAASWLKASASFRKGYWPNDRTLVVASSEDAIGIVTKAIGAGLQVTTNHIPEVTVEQKATAG